MCVNDLLRVAGQKSNVQYDLLIATPASYRNATKPHDFILSRFSLCIRVGLYAHIPLLVPHLSNFLIFQDFGRILVKCKVSLIVDTSVGGPEPIPVVGSQLAAD